MDFELDSCPVFGVVFFRSWTRSRRFWNPTWPQLGPQLRPKIYQKSTKHRSKSQPKQLTYQNRKKYLKTTWFSIVFANSVMLCYVEKSMKMVPRFLQNRLSNHHPSLDRFLTQLGSILKGFGGSFWHQNGTKLVQDSIPKTIKKMNTITLISRFSLI